MEVITIGGGIIAWAGAAYLLGGWVYKIIRPHLPWTRNFHPVSNEQFWRLTALDKEIAAVKAEQARATYGTPDYTALETRRVLLLQKRAAAEIEARKAIEDAKARDRAEAAASDTAGR